MRVGYVTRRGVVVKPAMVKNMGNPGKGFPGGGIGQLKSGVPKLPPSPGDSAT